MKFSVITINYNNIEGLRHTIESVVGQTYDDYEYIVIDGGSRDGSVDVVKEYSSTDKGIIYPSPSRELFMYYLYTASITHQSSIIRKDLLLKYPYDENYKIPSDWKFYLQKNRI